MLEDASRSKQQFDPQFTRHIAIPPMQTGGTVLYAALDDGQTEVRVTHYLLGHGPPIREVWKATDFTQMVWKSQISARPTVWLISPRSTPRNSTDNQFRNRQRTQSPSNRWSLGSPENNSSTRRTSESQPVLDAADPSSRPASRGRGDERTIARRPSSSASPNGSKTSHGSSRGTSPTGQANIQQQTGISSMVRPRLSLFPPSKERLKVKGSSQLLLSQPGTTGEPVVRQARQARINYAATTSPASPSSSSAIGQRVRNAIADFNAKTSRHDRSN